ncbi:tetratricopeptide repeat protein [Arcobacter sp. YIC-310]|uniref:tetratricopeptide repeat protein n=1 Tax=Arcobacter sp. YIC-310 TaxID=3376632 RepID=UPI003C17AB0F
MIRNIVKIVLVSISVFIFTACEPIQKKEEVKYKASLPMPEVKDEHINEYFKLSELSSAKKDPIPATKIGYAYSEELKDYDKAIEWFKYSNSMKPMGENSNYMCYAYQMKKEYKEAIKWCENAIELGSDEALIGLGFSYSKLKDYENALKWYLKASEKNHPDSMINLGTIYTKIKDNKNAEKWYKKAIEKEDLDAYQGISKFYYDNLKDYTKASAYAIALINTKYTKGSVLKLLQKTWRIPNETIKKGYELQLNSPDFPIKYRGDLNLE